MNFIINYIKASSIKKQIWTSFGLSAGIFSFSSLLVDFHKDREVNGGLLKVITGKHDPGFLSDKPEVGAELQALIDEVIAEDKRLSERHKSRLKIETYFGLKPWNRGTTSSSPGARVLLPDYFNVTSASQLRATKINALLQKEYNLSIHDQAMWKSPEGLALIDSFVLSRKAKKYLIANQLYNAENVNYFMKFLTLSVSLYSFIAFTKYAFTHKSLRDYAKSRPFTVVLTNIFLIASLMGFAVPVIHVSSEHDADARTLTNGLKKAIELQESKNPSDFINMDYFNGAIEYYGKVLARNRSIRHFLKSTNPSWNLKYRRFGEDGDEGGGFMLYTSEPISQRMKCFDRFLIGDTNTEEPKVI